MLKKLLKKPLFWLTVFLIVFIGAWLLNNFYSSSLEDNQSLLAVSNKSLFIEGQAIGNIESPDLALIQKNSLAGISCSQIFSSKVLGSLIGEDVSGGEREITEYVVQSDDNLSSIAANFDISVNTLLWANSLSQKSIIKPGQKLVILPVSGVLHHVRKGDTITEIAETYEGKAGEVIVFNDLSEKGSIFIGDILIIPNGVQPSRSYVASSQSSNYNQIPVASSYFICPVSSPYRITQWLHWYNAIDFANTGNSCGKPVFAAAGGQVLKIKYGYNQGAGNYIRILHPNGLITHYGHLQKVLVALGQPVSQGEMVGLMGYSGRTIPSGPAGCHLHFGLYTSQGTPPRNPFAK